MNARPVPMTALALLAALGLTACGGVHSGGSYSRHQAGEAQYVSRATILTMRDVQIDGSSSGLGQIGGGVLGGVAGSTLGKGTRATIAGAAVGGILGVVLGSIAESQITKTTATEFMLRQEDGRVVAVVQANDEHLQQGERVVVLHGSRVRVVRDAMPPASGAPVTPPQVPGAPPPNGPITTMPGASSQPQIMTQPMPREPVTREPIPGTAPGRIIWNPPATPS